MVQPEKERNKVSNKQENILTQIVRSVCNANDDELVAVDSGKEFVGVQMQKHLFVPWVVIANRAMELLGEWRETFRILRTHTEHPIIKAAAGLSDEKLLELLLKENTALAEKLKGIESVIDRRLEYDNSVLIKRLVALVGQSGEEKGTK